MGSYHYSEPERREPVKTRQDIVNDLAKKFFETKDAAKRQEALLVLYDETGKNGMPLVDNLLYVQNAKVGNGWDGIEIELKLNLPKVPDNVSRGISGLELSLEKQDRFLKSSFNYENSKVHHCFGTAEEERFILMENKDKNYASIKIKGQPQECSVKAKGMQGEEFAGYVLKREESIKEVKHQGNMDMLSFAETIVQGCSPTNTRYVGSFKKMEAKRFIIERYTGRLYSAVLSLCTAEKRDPLTQFELEYAGYIPKFPIQNDIESEKSIIQDILFMAQYFKDNYGLKPTALTKFDWISGKNLQQIDKPMEKKRKEISGGQVFFDEPIKQK